jgi:hydrogenase expression/formation protein HypE
VLQRLLGSIEKQKRTVVLPSVGVDVGITKRHGRYLVSSSDPITGTRDRIGWHAVNVSANDVATSGIMPDSLSVVGLFPVGTSGREILSVMAEINTTAKNLGIDVTGGHTEITPGLSKPIVVVTCFGSGDRFVTSAGARPDDAILLTKSAGIEGTRIIASLPSVRKKIDSALVKSVRVLGESLSILKEARVAFSTGRVHAMHDVTEGGVIGAVAEMSIASNNGFDLKTDTVPINQATRQLCKLVGADPLKLIGSGSLLIACSEKDAAEVSEAITNFGIPCTKIGNFLRNRRQRSLLSESANGSLIRRQLNSPSVEDEIWRILRQYG